MRTLLLAILVALPVSAGADDKPDLAVINRIKAEAFQRGQVMDHLFWLTDANGPRLTASPGYDSAARWAVQRLAAWGGKNAHLEKWGRFGRAWTIERFEMNLTAPVPVRLSGIPLAWSRGTQGKVEGGLVSAPLFEREDREDRLDLNKLNRRIQDYIARWRGKLHGQFVLFDPERELDLPATPGSERLDDKKLHDLVDAPELQPAVPLEWPLMAIPRNPKKQAALMANLPLAVMADFWDRRRHVYDALWKFMADEGVLGVLSTDDRGEGALVFAESTGEWDAAELPPPAIVLAPEDYGRLDRLRQKGVAARVALDLKVASPPEIRDGENVIAEIPGGHKRDEVVMLGAHLDSWHAGTGATDNGAGSAVMLEAFRILKTLGLKMDRTVRIALWSGEEQGLWGSRGYVLSHFGDPVTMKLKSEHEKLAGYFNLDNGSGKIRGVYLQGNDMVRPIFESWLSPFADEGAGSLSIRNTGGTDHLSFDAVGLPGFQFIQDPLDYGTRTHHSSLDVAEHAQAGDLMQAAAIVAAFVYETANRPEMLPRKPLPEALPARHAAP